MVIDSVITSTEASHILGVSVRQVQRLVALGELIQSGQVGRNTLIDPSSVHRLKALNVRAGRPWTATKIHGAIELLTNGRTDELEAAELSRMRNRLRNCTVEDLVRATRHRAKVSRYRASPSFIERLSLEVVTTGTTSIDVSAKLAQVFGLTRSTQKSVDGYATAAQVNRLIRGYKLAPDPVGNVTLRVTELQSLFEGGNEVVIALDLTDSLDSRERNAGLDFLTARLTNFTC